MADWLGVRSNVRVLSPTGEIAHERSRIERSEIGVARARIEPNGRDRATKARIERSEIGRPQRELRAVEADEVEGV
mgnify:FL=1